MTENRTVFQSHRELFRENAIPSMIRSPEYKNIEIELDAVLVLADRILEAFREDIEFNQIRKVALSLLELGDASVAKGDESRAVESLIQATEQWLKPILKLVFPARWTQLSRNKKTFTLFPTIRELNLLTQSELDTPPEESHLILDEVRRLIFWNRSDRNAVTHETTELPRHIRGRFSTVALVTLLAPLLKHQQTLRVALSRLIASPLPSKDVENLLTLIHGERLKHLERFCGREEWLQDLGEKLRGTDESRPYLLLDGHEGIGKSALCAKLSDELQSVDPALGRNAESVRRIAPWLPCVLLHFGKQSNQPHEIVKLILAQVNALLLEPLNVPEISDYTTVDDVLDEDPIVLGRITEAESQGSPKPGDDDTDEKRDRFLRKSILPDYIRYRRSIYLALERLSQERGPSILIIDAIDEITGTGKQLEFLPDRLPKGISALLTGRQNTRAVEWVIANREVEKIRLTGLTRDEIPLITKIDSATGAAEARFNEKVYKVSNGWPVLVISAAKDAQGRGGDLDNVQIDRTVDRVFSRQAAEWQVLRVKSHASTGDAILLLLAIFEPASALELELLQSYLRHRKIILTLPQIRNLLQPVAAHLDGLEAGRIKLSVKAFADYVRTRYSSKNDLRDRFEDIVQWLIDDHEIDAMVLAAFLEQWLDENEDPDLRLRQIVTNLTESLQARKDGSLLYQIYLKSRDKKLRRDKLQEFAVSCLSAAADFRNLDAMRVFGERLIDGIGVERDASQGESWLRKASEAHDVKAMVTLGSRLLDGRGLLRNRPEGEEWLRKASDSGDENASMLLATRLLDQQCHTNDKAEGERLLRDLAEAGNGLAKRNLAGRLVAGYGLPQDTEEGENILLDLAKNGDAEASLILAQFLLEGRDLPYDADKGEGWLRKATDAGNRRAKRILAIRLLRGLGLVQNGAEGERLLRGSAQDGNTTSMLTLGSYLLDGEVIPVNVTEGKQWLQRAADAGNAIAMRRLALRLIDGKGLPENKSEGLLLLRKAVANGDMQAARILGARLLDAKGVKRNTVEGKRYLLMAAQSGDTTATMSLARRLLNGRGFEKDVTAGEEWLRIAAESGDPDAMFNLAWELTDGHHLPHNLEEGETWIDKAIAAGSGAAASLRGHLRYRTGDRMAAVVNFAKGIELGSSRASINLAYMVRRNEVPLEFEVPTISDLLKPALENNEPIAIVNQALAFAGGIQCERNWSKADELFASLTKPEDQKEVLEWWHKELATHGDPEGHLVVGWLVRHQLIKDPDGLTIPERIAYARTRGINAPDWLNHISGSS